MKIREVGPGLKLFEPDVFRDARGEFLETWHAGRYAMLPPFVQDNRSVSRRGVLRGLHYQHPNGQGKLVSVPMGEVFDVAVDIRRGSPTFGRWVGDRLSGENLRQLWIPKGFAHGFCVLSETVHLEYKCTDFYDGSDEIAIAWDDPEIGIDWPLDEGAAPLLSDKDAGAPYLADAETYE